MKKVLILVLIFNFILVQAQDKVVTKNGKEIEVNNDASTTSKGMVKLAGDLGGTADSPTVPGLATKQNTLTLTTTGTGAATLTGATLNIPTPTFGTPFSLLGTSTEAGNDKTSGIWRTGGLFTGGSSTATLFGNLSTIGGTNFSGGFPKGLASIGLISNSTAGWTGSGFLFSNSVTGNNAFTATINNDKIYQAWLTPANTYTMTSIANSLGWGFGTNVPTGYSPTYGLEAVTTFKIGTLPTITNATEVLVPDPTTAQVSKQTIANIRNTPWFTAGTTTDAGGDKTNAIYRNGSTLIATGTTTQTTPLKSFHLQAGGASNLTSAFGSGQIFSTNDGSGARFFLEHTTSNVNEKTSVIYNQSGLTYLGAIVSDNGGSWVYPNPIVVKHSNGFVGFNQTTPSYQADINGTARIATLPAITTATEVMVPDPSTGQVSKQTIANIRNTPWFTAGTTTDAGGDKAGDIYRTGKIGIGATSPLTNPISRVEIIQNSLFSGTETSTHGMQIISGKTVGTDITLYMGADNTNANSYLQSVKWGTTTAPLVLNGRGGNVGIGTPTPANKLEITHGTAGNSGLRFTNLNSSSAATTSASKVLALNSTGDVILTNVPGTQNIVSFSTATPTTSGVVFTPNTPADQTVIYQSATDNSMWTYNGTVYNTYTAPSSTAWNLANTTNDAGSTKTSSIWRTGNIGIGTNNPTNNLDVVGGFHLRNTSGAAGSNYGIELNTNSNAPRIDWVFNGSYIGQFSSDVNNFLLQNSKTSTGGFRFTTNPGSGALDRLNILNNGNVGIGISNPLSKLHVNSETTEVARLVTSLTGTNYAGIGIGNGSGVWGKIASGEGKFQIRNFTTDAVIMNAELGTGNVGIGTTAPASRLDVNAGVTTANTVVNATGSVNDFLQYNIQNTSTGTQAQSGYSATANNGSATTGFAWMGINNSNFNFPTAYNIGGANDVSFVGSGQDLYLANANNTKSIIFSTGTAATPFFNERMRIMNSGNVGIGTSAPSQRLTIAGTNNQPATTGTTSNATLRIDGSSNHALDFGTYTNSPFGSYVQSVDKANFSTNLPLNLNPVAGNVGIGTSNPTSRLEVNGAATNTTAFNAAAGTSIDFSRSNLAYTTASAGAFTLTNLKDGGTYTLAVQGTTSGTSSFSGTNPSGTTLTIKYVNNGATIVAGGKHTLYTFLVMGTNVYVYMATGF